MKKLLALTMAVLMLLALTACGEKSEDLEPAKGVSSNKLNKNVSIEETVLVDEAGIKITAKSLDMDGFMGPELKLQIENNSGKNLTVQNRHTCVNGYMIDTIMSVDVADGKIANDSLVLMDTSLDQSKIETIAIMELSFHIFESENWEDYLNTDLIELLTSAASAGMIASPVHEGQVAYEADGIKIVVKGLDKDDFLGSSIVVYIENHTEQNITVQTNDVSINGFMIDPIFSSEVLAGRHAVSNITFLTDELAGNGITLIDQVELSFGIFDTDSWNDIVDTSPVTIKF